MFEKFARSWQLIKASADVLRQDKELLVFPAVSALAALMVVATFVLPLFGLLDMKALGDNTESTPPWLYLWVFLFYLVQYFVMFFFNTALVGAAMIRLEGGDPTVADGLRIARSKIGVILGYAAIAATVGMVLRAIEQRAGLIGRWVTGLIGAAWTVVSFLTVPVLVMRDVGPLDAVKESARLLKQTWGENIIGQGGVGLVFGLIQFLVIMATVAASVFMFAGEHVTLGFIVAGIGVIAMMLVALVQAALSGIYSAALYRHAAGLAPSPGFAGPLLEQAFAAKKK
jgi:Family of unknown function (DUF6159)